MRRMFALIGAMLRIGIGNLGTSRLDVIVSMVSSVTPLVMLAMWHAAARDAPVGGFDSGKLTAYFLAAANVQFLCSWQTGIKLGTDIRQGVLGVRLMRPVHPLVQYACDALSILPARTIAFVPLALVTMWASGRENFSLNPRQLLLVPVLLAGASFAALAVSLVIGTCSLLVESWVAIGALWAVVLGLGSGMLFPLSLLPPGLAPIMKVLPFRSFLAVPVETALGIMSLRESLLAMLVQWGWIAVFLGLAAAMWQPGIRRFGAHGG